MSKKNNLPDYDNNIKNKYKTFDNIKFEKAVEHLKFGILDKWVFLFYSTLLNTVYLYGCRAEGEIGKEKKVKNTFSRK